MMPQYLIQFRGLCTRCTSISPSFPNVGFINDFTNTDLISLPQTGAYLRKIEPQQARCFVIAYRNFGFLYQEYNVKEFGNFDVKEYLIMSILLKEFFSYESIYLFLSLLLICYTNLLLLYHERRMYNLTDLVNIRRDHKERAE